MCEWSKKSNQLNKGRYQPELYWTGKSRIRLGRTGLPDPGLLAAYGGNEVRGPINNFYGGHQSWTLCDNHTCDSLHRSNSTYHQGHRGQDCPLTLQGLLMPATLPSDSWIPVLTGVSHSPIGQRLTDKAWSADYLCPQEACEPHPVEPISSDHGCDHAQGRWSCLYSSEREQTNPTSLLKEFPAVRAEKGPPGLAKNHAPIMEDIKPGATPIRLRQYPVP